MRLRLTLSLIVTLALIAIPVPSLGQSVTLSTRDGSWTDIAAEGDRVVLAYARGDHPTTVVVEDPIATPVPRVVEFPNPIRFLRIAVGGGETILMASRGDPDEALVWVRGKVINLGAVVGQFPIIGIRSSLSWVVAVQRSSFEFEEILLTLDGGIGSVTRRSFDLPDGTSQGFLDVTPDGTFIATDRSRFVPVDGTVGITLPQREDGFLTGQWANEAQRAAGVMGGTRFNVTHYPVFEVRSARRSDGVFFTAARAVGRFVSVGRIIPPVAHDPTAGQPDHVTPTPPQPPPPSPPPAQSVDILALMKEERAKYGTPVSKVDLSTLLNTVAWRANVIEGVTRWGLLRKPSGNNCPFEPDPVACDILVTRPGMETYDVLRDGEGAAEPTFSLIGIESDGSRWVAPRDPGVGVPQPPPPPGGGGSPTPTGPDHAEIERHIRDLNHALEALRGDVAAIRDVINALVGLTKEIESLRILICEERQIEIGIRLLGTSRGRFLPCSPR